MRLCNIPNARLCEYPLRSDRRHAVESVIDDPIEHLNEKWKSLKDAAMGIIFEPRSVGGIDDGAGAVALLRL